VSLVEGSARRSITYSLHRLAPGSYDLYLDGEIVGGVVREIATGSNVPVWHAELLGDPPLARRPDPFSKVDHTFGTLDAVLAWLGGAAIANDPLAAQPLRI
jgi:hypothetical protein